MTEPEYWTKIPYWLHCQIASRISNEQDVEDVEQDILLHLWRSRHKFRRECSFNTWAASIARNRIVDFHRAQYKEQRRRHVAALAWVGRVKREGNLEEVINAICASQLISTETPIARYIVRQHIDGETFGEIAADLGVSYEATRSQWRRAVKRMSNRAAAGPS